MSGEKPLTKDTRIILLVIALCAVAVVASNKADIASLRAEIIGMQGEIRGLRQLIINHVSSHSHAPGAVVPTAGGAAETD